MSKSGLKEIGDIEKAYIEGQVIQLLCEGFPSGIMWMDIVSGKGNNPIFEQGLFRIKGR
jgi:hypothetical protein